MFAPIKFEVLLETAEERLELCESDNSGASYNLRFKEEPPRKNPWSKFVENRYISASKMLATLRKMIKEKVVRLKRLGSGKHWLSKLHLVALTLQLLPC